VNCTSCGTSLDGAAALCEQCARTRSSGRGPIAGHVRLLGILWLALSAFRLLPGLILVLLFSGGRTALIPELPSILGMILLGLGALLSLGAVAGIVTGWGLLAREPWARTLAIVLGALNLMDLPFGTALGIYTLWALLPEGSEREYRSLHSVNAPAR
jgi:hypothetical protein